MTIRHYFQPISPRSELGAVFGLKIERNVLRRKTRHVRNPDQDIDNNGSPSQLPLLETIRARVKELRSK